MLIRSGLLTCVNVSLACLVPEIGEVCGIRSGRFWLAAAAVMAGAQSFTVIGEWAADAPQPVLAALGARFDSGQDRYAAPDEATVRRVAARLDGDILDDVISNWLAHQDTDTLDPVETAPRTVVPVAIGPDLCRA